MTAVGRGSGDYAHVPSTNLSLDPKVLQRAGRRAVLCSGMLRVELRQLKNDLQAWHPPGSLHSVPGSGICAFGPRRSGPAASRDSRRLPWGRGGPAPAVLAGLALLLAAAAGLAPQAFSPAWGRAAGPAAPRGPAPPHAADRLRGRGGLRSGARRAGKTGGRAAPSPDAPAVEAAGPLGVLPGSRQIAEGFERPSAVLFEVFLVTLACFLYAAQTFPLSALSSQVLLAAEDVLQVVFIMEYLLRWYGCNLRPAYLLTPTMLVDLAAFLPFLLVALGGVLPSESATLQFLRLVRILRIQRFLADPASFAKLVGATSAGAVKPYELQLARTVNSVSTLVFISSGLVYNAEHEANPSFSNFFAALYFGLVTLTTVGYGDMVPITFEGRVIVCLSILVGVATIPVELSKLARALLDGFSSDSDAGSSSELLLALQEKMDRQQAQIDLIVGSLGLGGDAADLRGLPQGPSHVGALADGRGSAARPCGSCAAVGHRRDAGFCFRCGAALPREAAEETRAADGARPNESAASQES